MKHEGENLKYLIGQLNDLKAEIEEKEIKIQELQREIEKKITLALVNTLEEKSKMKLKKGSEGK